MVALRLAVIVPILAAISTAQVLPGFHFVVNVTRYETELCNYRIGDYTGVRENQCRSWEDNTPFGEFHFVS